MNFLARFGTDLELCAGGTEMKICDGADWFDPAFASTILNDIHETPRFHRKQWEFAAILNALRSAGVVTPDAKGISFGSGQELPLYALANQVAEIWATDLYTADSAWPTARTEQTARVTDFVREGAPFATRKERIFAKSMDMRDIEFPDESFDFAYSSSAVEHIGGWADFERHLAEVRRVLKPNGVYVMTTDISFGPTTECPGNFKFDPKRLEWWLQSSGMRYEPEVDCRVAQHFINTPVPADIACYITPDNGRIHGNLFGMLVMAHNITGCHPHTSVLLQMQKAHPITAPVEFTGFDATKDFLLNARQSLAIILEESDLHPHPAPWIPASSKHELWATTYMWLGARSRRIKVEVEVEEPGSITIGINKCHSDRYWEALVHVPEEVHSIAGYTEFEASLFCRSEYTYAVHGRALPGTNLKSVRVTVEDARKGVMHGSDAIVRLE